MDIATVLSFLGVAVLLTLIPGPDNLFVLAQSIYPSGHRHFCGNQLFFGESAESFVEKSVYL
ncbi:hypothetical protein PAJ34TS1_41650 [Paenibacillus azoreducens]|uniref:LysE family translocator n=1 Tax=Paenibacillus azoreducens TaxID=116718 RepID=A0A919YK95_9BACL|nr:hypothetical protein J34TS1_56180 [Paenibacillus azoreducens]